jgi:predicted molibdopterin-dependent oxidoreductase YjgC
LTDHIARITLNGRQVECQVGAPLVEVIKDAGVWISNLCYIDGLPPYAGCRTCLVEIEGARGLQLSCTSTVQDGMVVRTNSEEVAEARRMVISLINANHPDRCLSCHRRIKCKPGDICLRDDVVTHRCLTCSKNYRCELQTTNELAEMQQYEPFLGEERSYYGRESQPPRDTHNPYLEFDPQMCIICTRCVRACDDLHNTSAITLAGKGWQTRIAFGTATNGRDGYVHESNCDFCGTCIDVCPTAALMEHPNKWIANTSTWTNTACNYCAVGCSLKMGTRNGKGVLVRPDTEVNDFSRDQICVRGRFGYDAISDADRLGRPLLRNGDSLVETSWDEALDYAVDKLASLEGDAVAFLGSPYATTEENYLLARLAREVVGSDLIDSTAGPVASAVSQALIDALGTDVLPNNMEDFARATTLIVCAQDLEQTHPVASTRLKDGVVKNGARMVLVSSRHGELCDFAHVWLQPPPGLEAATLLSLIQETAVGIIAETRRLVEADPALVAGEAPTGQQPAQLSVVAGHRPAGEDAGPADDAAPGDDQAAAAEVEADLAAARTLLMPVEGADELINETVPDLPEGLAAAVKDAAALVLAGRGRANEGPMAFVLAPPEVNPRSAAAQTRAIVDLALVAAGPGNGPLWTHILPVQPNVNGMRDAGVKPISVGAGVVNTEGPRSDSSPTSARGGGFDAIIDGIVAGDVKALVCLRDNPLFAAPNTDRVSDALQKLDLLVVIEELMTETARLAHVVLPDVSVWGKDGTIVSADRRLMRQNAALVPFEEARPAWRALSELASRLTVKLGKGAAGERWRYRSAAEVMEDLAKDNTLFAEGPYCENSSGVRQPGQHPPMARLVPIAPTTAAATADSDFLLITHRGQFTSYEAAQLGRPDADKLHREEFAILHRLDAERFGADDMDIAEISGPSGSLEIPLKVTSVEVMPGAVFVPLYYQSGAVMRLLDHDPKSLVSPRVSVRLTGRQAEHPPEPVVAANGDRGFVSVQSLLGSASPS